MCVTLEWMIITNVYESPQTILLRNVESDCDENECKKVYLFCDSRVTSTTTSNVKLYFIATLKCCVIKRGHRIESENITVLIMASENK